MMEWLEQYLRTVSYFIYGNARSLFFGTGLQESLNWTTVNYMPIKEITATIETKRSQGNSGINRLIKPNRYLRKVNWMVAQS